jgi:putative ABC transport system permease protein
MDSLQQDLRFAVRAFRRQPGLILTALGTLALGIGAATAIFSVVQAVVLRPLPYPDADRIVALETHWIKTLTRGPVSAPDFRDWREQSRSFEALAYFFGGETSIAAAGAADYATVTFATASFFEALGFETQLGRLLTDQEQTRGDAPAAVITDAFWRRQFRADPRAVGATLKVGQRIHTIVGVLRPDYRYPARADVYSPAGLLPENPNRGGHNYRVVGRLKAGVTVDQAQAEMAGIATRLAREYPSSNADKGVAVVPLQDLIVGETRLTLYVLMAAVSFVLLIACANVANLLLARATARAREMVVRAAVGASRFRLARQLLTESAVLGLFAGTAGVLLARYGVTALIGIAPANLPRLDEVQVNMTALVFTLAISLIASVIFGLAPAFQLSRVEPAEGLAHGTKGPSIGGRGSGTRSAFVVAEIAFAVVLVTGAVLLGRSLAALTAVDLGYAPERLLLLRTAVPAAFGKLDDARRATAFYRDLLPEVRTLPGVTAAGAMRGVPTVVGSNSGYWIEGGPGPRDLGTRAPSAVLSLVTPDYFRTMRIPLLQGRDFTEGDRFDAPFVAVISESIARQAFPGQDPLGRRIGNGFDTDRFMTIVGVVRDVRTGGPEQPPQPEIYMPYEQHPGPATQLTLVVRTDAADPGVLGAAISRRIRARNPEVPVRIDTMEQTLGVATGAPRFRTYLLTTFAVVALLLAAAGVYGIMAFSVSQRVAEIGLRVALGATPRDILRLMVGQAVKLTTIGAAVGVALSLALAQLVSGLLFNVAPRDPRVLAGVVTIVAAASLAACFLPASLALRIRPAAALRSE